MSKKVFLILGLVAVLSSLPIAGCAKPTPTPEAEVPGEEAVHWRMTTPGSAGTHWHHGHIGVCERVAEMSGGNFTIDLYSGGELYPVFKTLDNVGAGVSEASAAFASYAAGIEPAFDIWTYLPGMPMNFEQEIVYRHDPAVVELVRECWDAGNCYYVGRYYMPQETFQSKVPIRSLEDFKGLNIRASGPGALMFEQFGAVPIAMPGGEVYTAFQTGTVDAGEYSDFMLNWEAGLQEVTKYIIEPCLHNGRTGAGGDYIVNKDAWNALPKEYKAIFEAACEENAYLYYIETKAEAIRTREKMIDYGLEVITLPDEDVEEALLTAQRVWKELAARSTAAGELMDSVREYCKFFGHTITE